MIKKLFYLFIFFAPFTSFFALSAWLRLPVIINQLLFIIVIVGIFKNNLIKTKWLVREDIYLLAFLSLIWISFSIGFRESRSFNHSLAYTNAILFFFFLSKYIITWFKIPSIKISKIIYWSFITISLIIIADFLGKNYLNFNVRLMFSEVDGAISNMDYFIRGGMFHVGGVAEEPGSMALFYNIYFGISLYYLYQKGKIIKWLFLLFISCHFAMFSNAGIVLPMIALMLTFSINKFQKLTITRVQLTWIFGILAVTIFLLLIFLFFDVGKSSIIVEDFFNKIMFNEKGQYSSSGQRLKQWQRALTNFIKRPIFGSGPGYGVDQDAEGYLSVYLTILSDIGIIAFVFFIAFQKKIVEKVMNLPISIRNFILFSVITSFLHLIIVADFYHAPFWILLVLIQLIYKEQKTITE